MNANIIKLLELTDSDVRDSLAAKTFAFIGQRPRTPHMLAGAAGHCVMKAVITAIDSTKEHPSTVAFEHEELLFTSYIFADRLPFVLFTRIHNDNIAYECISIGGGQISVFIPQSALFLPSGHFNIDGIRAMCVKFLIVARASGKETFKTIIEL